LYQRLYAFQHRLRPSRQSPIPITDPTLIQGKPGKLSTPPIYTESGVGTHSAPPALADDAAAHAGKKVSIAPVAAFKNPSGEEGEQSIRSALSLTVPTTPVRS